MEYKSRRERRHAQGGKVHGAGHPTAHKGPVLVIGLIKKKKDGGHVEGGRAKSHLGKRARGGRTEDTEHKVLNAREAAFDSDGIDKEAVGSGKDEREVPVEKRADGGATKSKYEVDDDSSKDMGDLDTPKRGSKNEYTTDDDDDKRARGGRAKRRADGGDTDSLEGDFSDRLGKYMRPLAEDADPKMVRKPSHASTDARGEHVFTPDLYQGRDKYNASDKTTYGAKRGGWIGPARERMERKGTVGSLHSALHVPQGEKIPEKKLESAAKHASGKLAKKIQFAENVRK